MPRPEIDRLREIVLADEALLDELFAERNQPAFVASVLALARDHGIDITEMDLWDALSTGRSNWLETWSP